MKLRTASVVIIAALAAPACTTKSNTRISPPATGGSVSTQRGRDAGQRASTVSSDDGEPSPRLTPVYFELDLAQLTADARTELQQLADWLTTRPSARITIEGHCDERGTDEYNVALGQKRATVIQEFLVRLGVAPQRLTTISYGEERPAATGSDEDAWALNRRGEIVRN